MPDSDFISFGQTKALLESARRRLVETGTRNRLVHVNRSAKRSNSLTIINERANDVFEILKSNRKTMKFAATKSDEDDLPDELLLLPNYAEEEFDEGRYTDLFLETPLTSDGLQKRLLRLAQDAKTAEEEQGVNILYLAIGFLQWFEAKSSSVMRESPLILLPVDLVRNERSSTYDIRCRDDDLVVNLPLQERMRTDFGIDLPEVDDNEDWNPEAYFARVKEAISGQPKWKVDGDGMQLGFFSFSKLLMLRDLDPENWPEDALMHSELVQRLLEDGFEYEPPLFPEDANLDECLEPSKLVHVVDADASQAKVIEEVRSGRNLVVQGPPGTGKSQTITNILASAAHDGKTVLFVAEKMAALRVVHDRMVKVGLGDLCLELHSKAANKKAFLQVLARTLANARGDLYPVFSEASHTTSRRELNRINGLLHETVPMQDYSPFEAMTQMVRCVGKGVPAPRYVNEQLAFLKRDVVANTKAQLQELCGFIVKMGDVRSHPFYGVRNIDLQPTDIERLSGEIRESEECIEKLDQIIRRINEVVGNGVDTTFDAAEKQIALLLKAREREGVTEEAIEVLFAHKDAPRFMEAIELGHDWQKQRGQLSSEYADAAWDYQIAKIRADVAKGSLSFWSRLFGGYRSACNELATLRTAPLPADPKQRLEAVDRLVVAQKVRGQFLDDEAFLKNRLGEAWRGERTDFSALGTTGNWLKKLLSIQPELSLKSISGLDNLVSSNPTISDELRASIEQTRASVTKLVDRLNFPDGSDENDLGSVQLQDFLIRLTRIRENKELYGEWTQFIRLREQLSGSEVHPLVDAIEEGELAPEAAVDEFIYATAEARWNNARQRVSGLNELPGIDRHALVERFKLLDKSIIEDTQITILDQHLSRLPQGASGEMGFLKGEIAKKRRHKSIRQAMTAAGPMIQRIKPVFMMSPISVAQFLPPGRVEFDLLVIDEASQVRPEEALGAIARSKQIVVVGDQKQLPPTSFFDRLSDDGEFDDDKEDDEVVVPTARAEEMESILTLCEARGLRPGMLEYHYRSKDPSLIMVSNKEFYEDRLVLPPTPLQMDQAFGLKFSQVPGVYSSKSKGGGRAGTNRIEAEAVVKALADHAKDAPDLSIGIVTFSKAQSDMMTEVLELARRSDETLDQFLREGQNEDVFVKNIENVQGDERDVILISVGYGPHEANGRLASMNFGPVNGEGGERRLNVMFTRARATCHVFASFDPGQIDLSRTQKEGPRVLKRFLEFAKTGQIYENIVSGEGADSPFEEDVADVIASMGYDVDMQVGSAGFKIDLGVRHPERPGQFMLAVECDGATYHSAIWARERDRQRQEILEGFGWRFHRIWSTDWFHNRAFEIERLRLAHEDAKSTVEPSNLISGANSGGRVVMIDQDDEGAIEPVVLEHRELSAPPYSKSTFSIRSSVEPHEVNVSQLAKYVTTIVADEGPIHGEEVARRIANGFGKSRTGNRIQSAVERALSHAKRNGEVLSLSGFWFTLEQQKNPPIRDRSAETSPTTKPEFLSDMEIRAAADHVKSECGEMELDELIRTISRLLGYRRAGQEFQARVRSVLV